MNKHGWTYKKFEEVFDLQMGKTPDRKNLSFFGGNNIWVSIKDLGDKYIEDSKEHITDEAIVTTGIKKVKSGTVIMSFKLTVGKCAIAKKDLYTNEAIMAFIIKDGFTIDESFLYYYLKGYHWSGTNKAVMGLTLNKATISKQKISIPSLEEQERIVAELDLLSGIIEKKKEQLKAYDQLAQSIFYDMFGDPVENERKWETSELNNVCDVRDGTHDSPKYHKEGYPLITSKNVVDGRIIFDNVNFISKEDFDNISKRSRVDDGDIIMPMIGTIGKPTIVVKDRDFAIKNVALIKFIPNTRVLNIFIQSIIASSSFDTYMKSRNKGGTQKFIALGDIRKLRVPVPPLPLQQEFAEKVEAIERQKSLVQASITEAETLFNSRMDYYFN